MRLTIPKLVAIGIFGASLWNWDGRASLGSDAALKKSSSWNWPSNSQVLANLNKFLDGSPAKRDAVVLQQLAELEAVRGLRLLEGIVRLSAHNEPAIAGLLQILSEPVNSETYSDIETSLSSVLANGGVPDWLKSDLQLLVSRSYVQNALYDEAVTKLEGIPLESVSDPSTLLFNLAVCQHHLLRRDQCVETLNKLLEREIDLPSRYAITARLMEADIKPLKEDSLDEISRMMNDVERMIALGRTGKVVRERQQAIIDKLDKSIDQIEQQLQQQQQQKKQQQQQQQKKQGQADSSKPLENAEIPEVKGPGEVDSKDIGNGSGWGNLPPAQRQEALQNMTKDLPSHYREVIEAYFKRLATSPK